MLLQRVENERVCGLQTSKDSSTHTSQNMYCKCSSKLLVIYPFSGYNKRRQALLDTHSQSLPPLASGNDKYKSTVLHDCVFGDCVHVVPRSAHPSVFRNSLSSNTVTYSTPRTSISIIFGSQKTLRKSARVSVPTTQDRKA